MHKDKDILKKEALRLLQLLISTPSFSKEEDRTATILEEFLQQQGVTPYRVGNNVYAIGAQFDASKPCLLLNSHHDTVRPNPHYTKDPFQALLEEDRLYGLGSNDAGGPLVSLIATFLFFENKKDLPFNIVLAATAEEEISGKEGIEDLLQQETFIQHTQGCFLPNNLHPQTAAIVGEPTLLQMAVAERGLMVLDVLVKGKPGHAAREEGDNAIYKAMEVIQFFKTHSFAKISPLLGSNKMSVTVIHTENKAHNVIPAECQLVVDTRINELYSFDEVLQEIKQQLPAMVEMTPRSTRLRSSKIEMDHPLVKAGIQLGLSSYGSPTTSDKALIPFPALKLGPGDSARSHGANEWIGVQEINQGIDLYIDLIQTMHL
ncbi:MAG: M20/M25/M40 family metallo-hydrolase [Chitinophagaceae bacterium]